MGSCKITYIKSKDAWAFRVTFRGKRVELYLGKLNEAARTQWQFHLDQLMDHARAGASIPAATRKFLGEAAPPIRDKLIAHGLIPATKSRDLEPAQRTVGGYFRLFVEEYPGSDITTNNYQQMVDWLLKSVKEQTPLSSLTTGDIRRWVTAMGELELSTRNKHLQRCKTVLRRAVEDGLITENPALAIKQETSVKRIDRRRQQFVSVEVTQKVMAGLSSLNWKLAFGLMRWQGLRRSEMGSLKWSDIDLVRNELHVGEANKTGYRSMPLFPEMKTLLIGVPEKKRTGNVCQFVNVESVTELLRKRVKKILGYCWDKTCHQLRSTRITELNKDFEPHVLTEWFGNTELVREQHYLQVTDQHRAKAVTYRTVGSDLVTQIGTHRRRIAAISKHIEKARRKSGGKPSQTYAIVARNKEKHPRQDSNLRPTD